MYFANIYIFCVELGQNWFVISMFMLSSNISGPSNHTSNVQVSFNSQFFSDKIFEGRFLKHHFSWELIFNSSVDISPWDDCFFHMCFVVDLSSSWLLKYLEYCPCSKICLWSIARTRLSSLFSPVSRLSSGIVDSPHVSYFLSEKWRVRPLYLLAGFPTHYNCISCLSLFRYGLLLKEKCSTGLFHWARLSESILWSQKTRKCFMQRNFVHFQNAAGPDLWKLLNDLTRMTFTLLCFAEAVDVFFIPLQMFFSAALTTLLPIWKILESFPRHKPYSPKNSERSHHTQFSIRSFKMAHIRHSL